jgi:hypothetical protein
MSRRSGTSRGPVPGFRMADKIRHFRKARIYCRCRSKRSGDRPLLRYAYDRLYSAPLLSPQRAVWKSRRIVPRRCVQNIDKDTRFLRRVSFSTQNSSRISSHTNNSKVTQLHLSLRSVVANLCYATPPYKGNPNRPLCITIQ